MDLSNPVIVYSKHLIPVQSDTWVDNEEKTSFTVLGFYLILLSRSYLDRSLKLMNKQNNKQVTFLNFFLSFFNLHYYRKEIYLFSRKDNMEKYPATI